MLGRCGATSTSHAHAAASTAAGHDVNRRLQLHSEADARVHCSHGTSSTMVTHALERHQRCSTRCAAAADAGISSCSHRLHPRSCGQHGGHAMRCPPANAAVPAKASASCRPAADQWCCPSGRAAASAGPGHCLISCCCSGSGRCSSGPINYICCCYSSCLAGA